MNHSNIIEQLGPEDFILAVQGPTGEALLAAHKSGLDLLVVGEQLSNEPIASISPRGITPWPSDMFARLLREAHTLLCTDDPAYAQIRDKLNATQGTSAAAVLSVVSGAVGAKLGFAAALTVPFLAAILAAVSKITVKAWCASQQECSIPSLPAANNIAIDTPSVPVVEVRS